MVAEIGRCPEEEEPPHTIGHELTHEERPRLLESEALPERDGLLFLLLIAILYVGNIVVLFDIVQFGLVHALVLGRLIIQPCPKTHPDEAQRTDDDESHLPTPSTGQQRNGGRSCQCTYRGTAVEDRGRESTVFLREIFCRGLDGCREVTSLTDSKNQTAGKEEPYRDGCNGNGCIRACLHHTEGFDRIIAFILHGNPSTACMKHGTERPYEDGNKITFLCAHPVDELSGKKVSHSIEQREETGNRTIVGIGPVELRGNEIFPCQREHLTVHVVNGGCQEEQRTDDPTEIGHLSSLNWIHIF